MVQREPVLICSPPRHQSFLNWYCFKRSFLDMLATSIPMILKNYLSKYIFWVAVGLATRVWQNQLDDKFLRSNWRVSGRHLFFLKLANHICCEFFGFRNTKYAPQDPQPVNYSRAFVMMRSRSCKAFLLDRYKGGNFQVHGVLVWNEFLLLYVCPGVVLAE